MAPILHLHCVHILLYSFVLFLSFGYVILAKDTQGQQAASKSQKYEGAHPDKVSSISYSHEQ